MTHRLLCIVAHPDDETFGAGGALTTATASGAEVYIACATRGEAGEIAERSEATPETLGQVREAEYHAAGRAMGVTRSQVFGYRDSGMPGTADNNDPRAFMNQPKDEIVNRVLELFDELRPQVVITFEPGGGYGHPDHMLISECVTDAVRMRQLDDGGHAPSKLYYFTFPRSRMRAWMERLRELEPENDFARMDPGQSGTEDRLISLTIDARRHENAWRKAIEAHRSQYSPLDRMPPELQHEFLRCTYLTRVFPGWTPGEPDAGIFAGL
jgi:LmbE family N-acetylglucosaminyl deacetylase